MLSYQLTSLAIDKITDLTGVHHTPLKQFSRFGDRLDVFPSRVQLMQSVTDEGNFGALSVPQPGLPSGSHRIALNLFQYTCQYLMRMRHLLPVHLRCTAMRRHYIVVQQTTRTARIKMVRARLCRSTERVASVVRQCGRLFLEHDELLVPRQVRKIKGWAAVVPHVVRALPMPVRLRFQGSALRVHLRRVGAGETRVAGAASADLTVVAHVRYMVLIRGTDDAIVVTAVALVLPVFVSACVPVLCTAGRRLMVGGGFRTMIMSCAAWYVAPASVW
ncbi:hypothetical protein [Streptomyces sp. SID685]|uniref:hypothetical protein n=1 Tax=Streptomyces sp. SID685 TaxID=2690322 RepID=UPI001F327702|nr:hypothetical protein [Streptomyces sp. SID685]